MFSSTWMRLSWSWVMVKSSVMTSGISATVETISVRSSDGSPGVPPLFTCCMAGAIGTGWDEDANTRTAMADPGAARPVARSSPASRSESTGSPLPATRMFRPAAPVDGLKSMTYCPAGEPAGRVRV
jgi:hypothetical protein